MAFAGLAIILFYLNRLYRPPALNNEIKIGSILILTGEGAAWGEAAKNGIELAMEEINEQGGVNEKKLKVIFENDSSDPKKALSAFQKLTDVDKAQFIIGTTWSHVGLPLVKLAEQKKVVMISPSLGVKEFNEDNPYLFNTWPHDFILSEKLAEYVFKKGFRRVAVFGARQVWVEDQTRAFRKTFEGLGGKIALLFEPNITDTDVRTDVLKLKNTSGIDAVIMLADGQDLTAISARRMKELNIQLPVFSITLDRKIINDCQGACDGFIFLTFLTPTDQFESKYQAKYRREVEIGADSAYDAVMMLADAMRKTNSTNPDNIKDYLAKIKTYSGASGNLISDGRRGFIKPYSIKQIQNGQPVTLP